MIIVNLFGGPCVGKSTLSAELFTILKKEGIEAVQVGEYVKECIQAGKLKELNNELFIFAEQARRLRKLDAAGEVEVAICDWPLLMAVVYDSMHFPGEAAAFRDLVFDEFMQYNNLNYFVSRSAEIKYETVGRVHNAVDAVVIDGKIETLLQTLRIEHTEINLSSVMDITRAVKKEMVPY